MQKAQKLPKFPIHSAFAEEVKAAKKNYFSSTGKTETGDWRLFSKTIILYTLLFSTYYILVFGSIPWWAYILFCIALGIEKAGIGFCVMHDAIHKSYSPYPWLNYVMGLSLNFLGANNVLWFVKHNIIHHTYVNIHGYDEDIEAKPLLRMHDDQPWLPIHRYQHKPWYWRSVYSLLYFQWIWYNDYKKYFTRKILFMKGIHFSFSDHIVFWMSKLLNIFLFVVVPIFYHGVGMWAIGYTIVLTTTSLLIATVFQLAHVVSGLQHPTKDTAEGDWYVHQIVTTADFAVGNKFLTWFLGGLNFQREHHLFPRVSHVHYPALRKELLPVYKKWDIPIVEYETMSLAVQAHVAELKRLSEKPIVVQL